MLNLGMDDVLDRKRALCLLQIMETGSVRGAADVLAVDPSMVSRTVARLEQDTGLVLLERRGRGVVVTDAGRMLALDGETGRFVPIRGDQPLPVAQPASRRLAADFMYQDAAE